jgi:hydrogenase expression/formation protein HypE
LSHGSGGKASAQLVEELFQTAFANAFLDAQDDGAQLPLPALAPGQRLAVATDSHVVSPLFFPGGDIGCLAVHGTLNDVAMNGARPLWLAAAFVLEEGLPLADLRRSVESMAAAARDAGVPIVTGDTKVVERGKGDGVFITTTGVGVTYAGSEISAHRAAPGDRILVSGTLGDHGVAVMSKRQNMDFATGVVSDTAALHGLVEALLRAVPDVHVLRDPTRGGLASTLNEIAQTAGVGMRLQEQALPVREEVRAACEFLGLDPLYCANEGKLIAICPSSVADTALRALRAHPLGRDAALIGDVVEDRHRFVSLQTVFGGERMIDWLAGEQLPRIC